MQMAGGSPTRIQHRPAVRRRKFRRVTTRSLGTSSDGVGFTFFLSLGFLAAVGFWVRERGGTVEAVKMIIMRDERRKVTFTDTELIMHTPP
jgi:hypothetical protein